MRQEAFQNNANVILFQSDMSAIPNPKSQHHLVSNRKNNNYYTYFKNNPVSTIHADNYSSHSDFNKVICHWYIYVVLNLSLKKNFYMIKKGKSEMNVNSSHKLNNLIKIFSQSILNSLPK